MYRILIVDDERIERQGILQLIKTHKLDLETILAENGEVALEIIKNQPIDILITDIKMPFMDGLELAEHVSKLNPNIEIIIYSAFNEFEYARRALRTNISNYLLKPIQVTEFLAVLKQTIETCDELAAQNMRTDQLLEGYNRGLLYEKEKMLLDALNGKPNAVNSRTLDRSFDQSDHTWIHLIIADCGRKFFDIHHDSFTALLKETISYEFDYVNMDENQSVLFINHHQPIDKETLRELGESIIQKTREAMSENLGLVVGKAVDRLDQVHDLYTEMERMLEFRFFMEDQAILFSDEQFAQANFNDIELNQILEKVYQCLEYNDIEVAKYSLELLFSYLKTKGQFSSLYTKFICSEIMKKAVTRDNKLEFTEMNVYLDSIYRTVSLHDLKDFMFAIFDKIEISTEMKAKDDSNLKLIRTIRELIEKEYGEDLSLEGIAERVYLTPSYLSYLFKKETGQSLIRYITQVRMEKAALLLTESNMKIVDMYTLLGYRSSTYFIQTFRNYYGVTPAKFRESSS
ncbi:two-component system response regulator YesN [Paenibacillus endophyticus]|uniref:Two-component system response regulator YesN n=1 Tax=Paenibacillus endophyticus TaxID=1294268 RepID=A0A7W5C3V2_9BACL|nr:response regulator [Paenibacillus endophyticus]MBB3150508.1 two-component system response regulator YesN [Paenibacillus endophyticus]